MTLAAGDGRPWFDPSPDTLRDFADECRVRYDVPPVTAIEPVAIGEQMASEIGLDASEREIINRVLRVMHERWMQTVRALYIEATGDTSGAEVLSPQSMGQELQEKSVPGEEARVRQRIAQERAGLAEPPTDWQKESALSRYYRSLGRLGDEMEALLGSEIGVQRARQLRERTHGWGQQEEYVGCPKEGAINIETKE